MSREQPSIGDVRDIEDVILDLQKLLVSKLPTTRKDVLANWGTFVEAEGIYRFSKGIIDDPDDDRWTGHFLWVHHGQYQAAYRLIFNLADSLGVPTGKYDIKENEKA